MLQACCEGIANERVADNILFFLLKLLANVQTSWDARGEGGGVGLCSNSWSHSRQPRYGLLIVQKEADKPHTLTKPMIKNKRNIK